MKQWSTKILSVLLAIGVCMTNMAGILPEAHAASCPDSQTGNHVISNSGVSYVSNGSSGHSRTAVCQACGARVTVGTSSHSYSTSWNGCYYTRTCSDCGYSTSGVSHSWSSYSYTYKDSSTHTGKRTCNDCGTTSSTSGNHSTTTRYTTHSDTQHAVEAYCATCNSVISSSYNNHSFSYGSWVRVDDEQCCRSVSCSVCTYAGTAYQNHVDRDYDGRCDSCNADITVDVTFLLYGTTSNTVTVSYGGTVDVPNEPSRPGYDFVEWVDLRNGDTYDFSAAILMATTIEAVWEARNDTPYKVEHYQQDIEGDSYTLVDTDHLKGTTDTKADAEEKTYAGFHLNEMKSAMEGNIDGDGSLLLNVYYDRDIITVSVDMSGETKNLDIRYGGTLAVPEEPARPGYDFVTWVDSEGSEYDFTVPITGSVTLMAAWEARNDTPYKVKHYQQDVFGDGYTLIDTESHTGTTDTTAFAVVRSFTGFHEANDHAEHITSGNIDGNGSLILKVYYDRDPMTITIDLGGETTELDIRYGGTLAIPEDPARPGYDFVSWVDTEGNEFDFTTPITGPVTLGTTWEARNDTPYKVEHYQQDVTGDSYTLVETESFIGTTDTIATAMVKRFAGFHEAVNHMGHVLSGNIDGDGSRVLKVYYDRDIMKITLNLDGKSEDRNIIYGGTLPIPETPVRPGYDFVTWLDTNGDEYNFNTPIIENIELKAEWQARNDTPYQVKHYQQNVTGEGYTLVDTENLMGTTDTTATAVAENYTGFHENIEYFDRAASGNIDGDGSLILSLYYDRNAVTVNFDAAGGKMFSTSKEVLYGAPYGELPIPARNGYDFGGWWVDEDHQVTAESGSVTEEHTLLAQWTVRGDTPYTIIHYLQSVDKEGYEQGDVIKMSGVTESTATAQAQSYTGFHINEEHPGHKTSGIVAGDGSLILALYYDRNTITISIDLGQDTPLIQEVPYGGSIARPEDPTRPGYIFIGWQDEDGNAYDFGTPITEALTLTPSWRIRPRPMPPRTEEDNLLDGLTPLSGMPGFEDILLTRAQAAYIFALYYDASVEDLNITTAFDDVSVRTEYGLYITWIHDAGVELGYGNRQFGPTDALSREQLALMLYRVYGNGDRADLSHFEDSESVSWWAYDAVCWAVSKDILPDLEDGTLCPQDGVTGREMVMQLRKAAELSESQGA